MCYGQQQRQRTSSPDDVIASGNRRSRNAINALVVEDLRGRLAETESRLERARAREVELSRQLEEMKRFVSVMEILESYLKRQFRQQQQEQHVTGLFSSSSVPSK